MSHTSFLPREFVRRLSVIAIVSLPLCVVQARRVDAAAEAAVNSCGCGRGTTGSCFCQKTARCGCPGECEPKGCDEKRAKQLEKEIEAETRRAADEDRKRNAANTSQAERREAVDSADEAEQEGRQDGRQDGRQEGRREGREPKTRAASRSDLAIAPPTRSKPAAAKRLTQAQKKELAGLIEAYLSENPDRRGRTIEQLRTDLER